MKRDWEATAKGILAAVGGPENISGMTHCATRLRLNLRDDSKCDDAAVKEVDGVVNTVNSAGQYQVLIGTEVPKLYEKFEPLVKGSGARSPQAPPLTRASSLRSSPPSRASLLRCCPPWPAPVSSAVC